MDSKPNELAPGTLEFYHMSSFN